MVVELVKTTTSDGLRLDGALHQVPSAISRRVKLDAVICIHGVASNFYGSTLLESLSDALTDLGIASLRINTRGHDTLTTVNTPAGPRRMGAAYEVVQECQFDIAAWVGLLVERGYNRVGLLGHSLGAIKSIFAASHDPPSNLQCVIAASAPRLSYKCFSTGSAASDFLEAISTAQLHVREGRPLALFEARVPFPLIVGAAAYLEKYGPEERYDILRFIDRLNCPALFTFGALELTRGGVAFAGLAESIREIKQSHQDFSISVIPEADHFYSGVRQELNREVCGWLRSRFAS